MEYERKAVYDASGVVEPSRLNKLVTMDQVESQRDVQFRRLSSRNLAGEIATVWPMEVVSIHGPGQGPSMLDNTSRQRTVIVFRRSGRPRK